MLRAAMLKLCCVALAAATSALQQFSYLENGVRLAPAAPETAPCVAAPPVAVDADRRAVIGSVGCIAEPQSETLACEPTPVHAAQPIEQPWLNPASRTRGISRTDPWPAAPRGIRHRALGQPRPLPAQTAGTYRRSCRRGTCP